MIQCTMSELGVLELEDVATGHAPRSEPKASSSVFERVRVPVQPALLPDERVSLGATNGTEISPSIDLSAPQAPRTTQWSNLFYEFCRRFSLQYS